MIMPNRTDFGVLQILLGRSMIQNVTRYAVVFARNRDTLSGV